jgi:hypothetical protein
VPICALYFTKIALADYIKIFYSFGGAASRQAQSLHHGDFLTSMGVDPPSTDQPPKKPVVIAAKPTPAPAKSTVLFRDMSMGYYYSITHLQSLKVSPYHCDN